MKNLSLRIAANQILASALAAVKPERLIKAAITRAGSQVRLRSQGREELVNLEPLGEVFLVAFGKAAPFMATAFLELLGDRVKEGIVVCLPGIPFFWPRVQRVEAPHPFPDERSVKAAEIILSLGQGVQPNDRIFFLISGGASAQIAKPLPPITLEEKTRVIKALMKAGADIKELNVVRKHLSAVKGGRMGAHFAPATLVNLIISDVIGDDVETIASAPTAWDSSTFLEAREILKRYKLWEAAAISVREVIEKGIRGEIKETRKKEQITQAKVINLIVGNNRIALTAAAEKAKELGFKPVIVSCRESGEARRAAQVWASLVQSLMAKPGGLTEPLALMAGGELTVTVKGAGLGGRNTEFCLALLREWLEKPLPEEIDWCGASLATDGRDGPTEAAGALIYPSVLKKAAAKGLALSRYLDNNDSFSFFKKVGSLIRTGPTKTNVMDIRLLLLRQSINGSPVSSGR